MTLLIALLSISVPAFAVPVDLRTLASSASPARHADSPTRTLPHNSGPYYPGCEILSSREVINEILALGEVLQNEAMNLDLDALDLWSQWRNTFGQAVAGRDEARQVDAFNLHQAARQALRRSRELMLKLENADATWWKHWRALDAAAKAGRDGSDMRPQLDKFKTRLASIAADSNALDAAIRAAQAQYDFTRPALLERLEAGGLPPGSLRQPWHWNYLLAGRPRPDLRYDFEDSYDKHYEASHARLRTRGFLR